MKSLRNFALGLFFASSAIFLSGCGENNSEANITSIDTAVTSTTLNVFNWGNYINPIVLEMFEEETGIRINYSTFDSNETMYTRIVHTGAEYDVIFPSDYMIYRMIQEDLLQTLNFDNIPNFANISDRFIGLEFDPDNLYSVPYMWGTLGILYNTTMVDTPVYSWEILWNEDYAGQIFMYASERDSMAVALAILGYSLNSTNEAEIMAARDLLIEQKPLVIAYVTDQVKDFMIGGEGALALVYSGDALFSIQQNPDLRYVIPIEGSNIWVDAMVVPRTSTNVEAAEMFINFMLRPDVSALNTNLIGFSTPNIAAIELGLIYEELLNSPVFDVTDDEYARLEVFIDLGDHYRDLFTQAFTTVLAS